MSLEQGPDQDCDCLPDEAEIRAGTDLNNADTKPKSFRSLLIIDVL